MKFNIYFKEKNNYILKEIEPNNNISGDFFRILKIQINIQLENIRQDLLSFADNTNNGYLMRPLSNDNKKQKIINELVKFRKNNQDIQEQIKALISGDDVIICEMCHNSMHKIPVNINYEKIGNSIIIKEKKLTNIKYIYACDKCPFAIDEVLYKQKIGDNKLYNL